MGKRFSSILRPALHLTGCMVHGHMENYFWSDDDTKKDPNTQCEALSLALIGVWHHCKAIGAPRPRNVFVQADNCPREMRNQYTLLWGVALLLLSPALTSVTYNFLRKGHTHEDIGRGSAETTDGAECQVCGLYRMSWRRALPPHPRRRRLPRLAPRVAAPMDGELHVRCFLKFLSWLRVLGRLLRSDGVGGADQTNVSGTSRPR